MYDSGAGSGGGSSRYYWRDGIKYSAMNDPELGHIMSDGLGNWIPDTRWQTLPIRALNNAGNFLGDAMVRGLEGYQEASGNIKKIGDALTPDGYSVPTEGPMRFAGRGVPEPVTSGGPLSRGPAYQRYVGRVGYFNDDRYFDHPDLEEHKRVTTAIDDATSPYVYPGDFERMANEGYDSWSPSDAIEDFGVSLPYMTGVAAKDVDTRTEWQKWKDSFKRDWAVRE